MPDSNFGVGKFLKNLAHNVKAAAMKRHRQELPGGAGALKQCIVDRLTQAYEDEHRADVRRPREADKWTDTLLIGGGTDRVINEWVEILKDHSGIEKIATASSIGRYAVLVPLDLEEKLRPSIEACLPGFRHYYENIEMPRKYTDLDERERRLPVSWYTVDSRDCLRLVSAVATNQEINHELNRIGLNPVSDAYLDSLTSYQRGCIHGWATTVWLFQQWGCPLNEISGGVDILPDCLKPYVPEEFQMKLAKENARRLPRGEKEIAETEYLVEANHNETHHLWQQWALQAESMCKQPKERHKRFDWQQGVGIGEQIGKLDGRPVMITVFWNKIDGHQIGFWTMESQVTDHAMAEKWLDKKFPSIPRIDAANFSHVIHALIKDA